MVLAEDHPKITAIFPHTSGLQAVTSMGRDFSGVNDIKSRRTISRKAPRIGRKSCALEPQGTRAIRFALEK
jgi:hypothetical protein